MNNTKLLLKNKIADSFIKFIDPWFNDNMLFLYLAHFTLNNNLNVLDIVNKKL